ncbi:MAG: DUF4070 domain-containing protein, partial [Kiritimatiellales bacterium]|nr:DUF4070 domain-containing protein [Kiritimatiellales bacterium]
GLLQAPTGTRLYERMEQEGRLDAAASGDNADGTTNIIPAMSLEALKEGYRKILSHIYSPAPYYRRVRTFLREYKPVHVPYRLRFCHVRALFRAFYLLGIVGKERVQYWKLMLWTQFRHPRLVPKAIMLAIYGYHFRKVCEKHVV